MFNHTTFKKHSGINIRHLPSASPFYKAGLRKGDRIVAVNGETVSGELEVRFFSASPHLRFDVLRNSKPRTVCLERKHGGFLDIEFYQEPIGRCANKCIFCFIDQMPPGMRRRLYIKDEDLTHSFLNGNYVTLANAGPEVLQRIMYLGLSPVFVSVHATDPLVRNRMLGTKQAPPIMEQLSFLARNNIQFHTQIVVCPGYNDGAVLTKTVKELFSLGPGLLSVAVVPVGLTRFRTFPLAPVDAARARKICGDMGTLSDRDKSRQGKRRLFLADELFLKATGAAGATGADIPPAGYYEEYPQIENGVGLVRQMLDKWKNAVRSFPRRGKRYAKGGSYLLVTSCSAIPFLNAIVREMKRLRPEAVVHPVAVPNRFFGVTVTVAGLLTARDVLHAVRRELKTKRFDRALLPAVMFNYAGYTLDGYSAQRLAKEAGVKVIVVESVEKLLELF